MAFLFYDWDLLNQEDVVHCLILLYERSHCKQGCQQRFNHP